MWKKNIMGLAVVAACAGLVVACGGGGGNAAMTPSVVYTTLAPYAALPSDASCAAQVRAASRAENRPDNAFYNATIGKALPNFFNGSIFDAKVVHSNQVTAAHISGNFTGTTEDILRWGACKWGIDENVVKAMASNESQWQQAHRFNATNLPAAQAAASAVGNTLTYHNTTNCATNTMPGGSANLPRALPNPLPVTQPQGSGATSANCSRDWGILQLNYEQHPSAWPEAEASTAMNVDVVLAIVRACYDGDETWISTKPANLGAPAYAAGDLMGCVGRYNAGAWYDAPAITYINRINTELTNKTWTQPTFQNKAWVYP